MPHSNLHLLPIFLGTLFPVTFFVTYLAAVLQGHVPAGLPFISDAGSYVPQSCFFGQSLNIAAAVMALCVYIRHRQLLSQRSPHRPSPGLLRAGLWTGWTSALGVSMVANFQLTNLGLVHGIGAFLAFGVGIPYFWIQVACTRYDPPERFSKSLVHLRWILAMVATLGFVLTIVGSGISYLQRGGPRDEENYEVGYSWFLVGSISEWVMALSMAALVVTLARDFQHISVTTPQVMENKTKESNQSEEQNASQINNNNNTTVVIE